MKKIIFYVLILVAIIGFLSPLSDILADLPPIGLCTLANTNPVRIVSRPESDCKKPDSWAPNTTGMTGAQATAAANGTSNPVTPTTTDKPQLNYHLLSPLPCPPDTEGCDPKTGLTDFDPTTTDANGKNTSLGIYLNLMIKVAIGLAGVMAVVMVVMGGIEYMTSELVSSKEAGMDRVKSALLGLLIALGAYALLNTINPDLLNNNLSLQDATVKVSYETFEISAAQSRDGKPATPVDFKTACSEAAAGQANTGVDKALVLAIFKQESGNGSNTGSCLPANANMRPEDLAALTSIVGSANVATTHVSCPIGTGGHGGAIGVMQFLPSTWLTTRDSATQDPWNPSDAQRVAAVLLQKNGALTDPRNAACKYYSGVACKSGRVPPNEFYGDQVINKMNDIKTKIAKDGC